MSGLILTLARDTAPFICLGNWVSLLNVVGLSVITMQTPATLHWT